MSSKRPHNERTPLEPPLVLRPGPMIRATLVTLVVCMAAVGGFAQLTDNPRGNALAAIAGLALTGGFFIAGTFVIASGKPRPVATIATLWLAATVMRVLGLGVALFSIYFAAPQDLPPLVVGAGGAYLACLAVETAMTARQALRSQENVK